MAAVVPAASPRTSLPGGPNGARKSFDGPGRRPRGFRNDRPKVKVEPKTLFQTYFKSVGPRTYAAQLKEAGNGNHFLMLTEGKHNPKTDELKKCSLFVFSEDFDAFKDLLRDTFKFIADHPVSDQVKSRQAKYWAKTGKKLNRG